MPRRVSLPGASELFRPTDETAHQDHKGPDHRAGHLGAEATPPAENATEAADAERDARAGSGRVRHDEKFTVYVSADELLGLEQARITLRRDHGIGVDRGRLVRAALAIVMEDFDARGADSALVGRLREL